MASDSDPRRPHTSAAADKLLAEAQAIVAMAEDLLAAGLTAEALMFASIAAERVQAAKALQAMASAGGQR